jgi:hypothetical protein
MYRKNRVFDCKNRANGLGGSVGLVGGSFRYNRKTVKEFHQVLDFQRFAVFTVVFTVALAVAFR